MDEVSEILKFDPGIKKKSTVPKDETVSEILQFDPGKVDKAPEITEQKLDVSEQEQPEMSWDDAFTQGVKNLPSSGAEYIKSSIKGLMQLITSPVETAKGFGAIAKGFVKTGVLRIMADELGYDYNKLEAAAKDKDIDIAERIEQGIKDTYGTEKGLKEKIANDPAGFIADTATVVAPLAKSLGLPGVASYMEPASLATKIVSQPLKLIPEKLPIHMYQSAVKFGTTLSQKERNAVTRTALAVENQIMPTSKGMVKLRNKIDDFNNQVNTLLKESTQKGTKLNVHKLFMGVEQIKNQFKRLSDEPTKWDTAFSGMKKQWIEVHKIGWQRTPEEIQKIKVRIYKDLESFYEKQKATPAKVELRKAVARNARKMLEDVIPEVRQIKRWFEKPKPTGIKQINKAEGALLDLWDAIESKSNRITNRDFISIGLPIKMGAGAGIGGLMAGSQGAAVGSGLGLLLGVFDTPQVKAKLALMVNVMRDSGITIKPTAAGTALGLYQTGELSEVQGAFK